MISRLRCAGMGVETRRGAQRMAQVLRKRRNAVSAPMTRNPLTDILAFVGPGRIGPRTRRDGDMMPIGLTSHRNDVMGPIRRRRNREIMKQRFPNMLESANITCPYCWETLEILLDLSVDAQDYIEDCQVCCQPIRIQCTSLDGELLGLEADRSDG